MAGYPSLFVRPPTNERYFNSVILRVRTERDEFNIARQRLEVVRLATTAQDFRVSDLDGLFVRLAQSDVNESLLLERLPVNVQPLFREVLPSCVRKQAVSGPDMETGVPVERLLC